MARPLSIDLRERVVTAVREGASCRVVASRFGVAVSSVVKWAQRARRTGSVAPGQMGGHRRPILAPHRDFVLARLKERPETTLRGDARAARRRARGAGVARHDLAVSARRAADV